MDIKSTGYVLHYNGKDHKHFDITVSGNGCQIYDTLEPKEAYQLAVEFLEDTLLYNCWQSEIVGKLIEAGVITHEMILEYVAESGEE